MIQRDEDGPERGLEAGLLVEELDDLGGLGSPLELHHEPQAVPIRLVTDVGQVVDPPLPGEARDLLDDPGFGDRIRQLGDDELFLPAPQGLLDDAGPHDHTTAPLLIHVADPVATHDESPCREVGAGQVAHHNVEGRLGLFDQGLQGGCYLPEVVRRDVGAEADGDPG